MASISDWWKEEKGKLKTMTASQAVQYIVSYYWIPIVGITAAVFLAVFLIRHIRAGEPQYALYGIFANTLEDGGIDSQLYREFTAYAKIDSPYPVEFDSQIYLNQSSYASGSDHYFATFLVLAETGALDFITMTPEDLCELAQSGRLMNLNDPDCAAIAERYHDRWIFAEVTDEEGVLQSIPIGFDISDSALVETYGLYREECALGLGLYSSKTDTVMKFMDFVLEGRD